MNKGKRKVILAIAGVVLILAHMCVHHFAPSSPATDFTSGLLLGVGLVFIIASLFIKKAKPS